MTPRPLIAFALLTLAGLTRAQGAELTGTWTAEFNTSIGAQKYTYEFKADGDKFSGKATYDRPMGRGAVELKDVKLSGDVLTFAEPVSVIGLNFAITYTGKISGDEIKFTRQVGTYATEQLVARRVKPGDAKPAARPAPAK